MANQGTKRRIVIVGGGFGGVKCARVLSKGLKPEKTEVVLFNEENHLVFSPLLAEVVGSTISPLDVVVPLRQLLPRIFCRTESVQNVDLKNQQVEYQTFEGRTARMDYD